MVVRRVPFLRFVKLTLLDALEAKLRLSSSHCEARCEVDGAIWVS